MAPRLVVLTPARNAAGDLPEFFDSVQRFADAVVALDDGSTDDTRAVLASHPLVTRLLVNPRRPHYRGWDDSANRNQLLRAAAEIRPDWILSLDADERLDAADGAALRRFVDGGPDPELAYMFRIYRMIGDRSRYDRAHLLIPRLFAYRPGQTFAPQRLHLQQVPESLPRTQWQETTLRIQHVASTTPERRRARFEKYAQVDPDNEFQSYDHLLAPPRRTRKWRPRSPRLPALPSASRMSRRAPVARRRGRPSWRHRARAQPGRTLVELVGVALRLAWRSAPRELVLSFALQVLAAALLGLQLLAARSALAATLRLGGDGASTTSLAGSLILAAAVFVALSLVNLIRVERGRIMSEMVASTATGEVLRVTSTLPLERYDTPWFHDQLDRARSSASSRPALVATSTLSLTANVLGIAGIAAGVMAVQPLILPAALLVLLPLSSVTARSGRANYAFARLQTTDDRLRNYYFSTLTSVAHAQEVRSFGLGALLRQRHEEMFATRIARVRRLVNRRLVVAVVAALCSGALLGAALVGLAWLLSSGRTDAAGAAAAFWALFLLAGRLQAANASAGSLLESALYLDDLQTFMELDPEAAPPAPGAPVPAPAPPQGLDRLVLEDVSFTYPGARHPALTQVDLEVGKGEVVAVVGENGSGKTTLAKLVAHLYTPERGQILWDGIDTSGYDRAAIRSRVAAVFQDFVHWELSAHDNISFGDVDRADDREAAVVAATRAQAHSFLGGLPAGYETILSRLFKGGSQLSHGQWQRVSLARAFFKDAPLLVVDEPTASLDALGEKEIYRKLREISLDRAVLLISHRLASVRFADRIYVMHEGQVVDRGTHDELLARCGRYGDLFLAQGSMLETGPTLTP